MKVQYKLKSTDENVEVENNFALVQHTQIDVESFLLFDFISVLSSIMLGNANPFSNVTK